MMERTEKLKKEKSDKRILMKALEVNYSPEFARKGTESHLKYTNYDENGNFLIPEMTSEQLAEYVYNTLEYIIKKEEI